MDLMKQIEKNGNKYQPIVYYNKMEKPKVINTINDSFSKIQKVNNYCGLIIEGINNQIQNIYDQSLSQLNIKTLKDIDIKTFKAPSFFVDNYPTMKVITAS